MEVIRASKKYLYGNEIFQVKILYPGEALGLKDTGLSTIGRIDHANFKPPGIVPMHLHKDDEILSYMRSGIMVHKDSAGHKESLDASHMMMMNAGTGIRHEEEAKEEIEMLQIFMRPSKNGLEPKVQFHKFQNIYSENQWRLIAGDTETASLRLRTGTNIFDVRLGKDSSLQVPGKSSEKSMHFLYCFNGAVTVGDNTLNKGDCFLFNDDQVTIKAGLTSDLILFQIKEDAEYSDTGMFSGQSI